MTSTAPAACAGVVAVISVSEWTPSALPEAPPNVTSTRAERFVPVIVTVVPPAVEPVAGETLVTVGEGRYV